MSEHPIIFSGPMVRAILDGPKTQARRAVKPQPRGRYDRRAGTIVGFDVDGKLWLAIGGINGPRHPYVVGGRLWVREKFAIESNRGSDYDAPDKPLGPVRWHEDEDHGRWFQTPRYFASEPDARLDISDGKMRWTSPRFMPRWASRITLEIIGVRIKRLNDISEIEVKRV